MKEYKLSFICTETNVIKRVTVKADTILDAIKKAEEKIDAAYYDFLNWD